MFIQPILFVFWIYDGKFNTNKYGYTQHTKLTLLSLQALIPYEIASLIEM
jgi:hypothetical protein